MLSGMSQSQKDKYILSWLYLFVISKIAKCIGTKSGIAVARGREEEEVGSCWSTSTEIQASQTAHL